MRERHSIVMDDVGFDFAFEIDQPLARPVHASPGIRHPLQWELALVEREIRNLEALSRTQYPGPLSPGAQPFLAHKALAPERLKSSKRPRSYRWSSEPSSLDFDQRRRPLLLNIAKPVRTHLNKTRGARSHAPVVRRAPAIRIIGRPRIWKHRHRARSTIPRSRSDAPAKPSPQRDRRASIPANWPEQTAPGPSRKSAAKPNRPSTSCTSCPESCALRR